MPACQPATYVCVWLGRLEKQEKAEARELTREMDGKLGFCSVRVFLETCLPSKLLYVNLAFKIPGNGGDYCLSLSAPSAVGFLNEGLKEGGEREKEKKFLILILLLARDSGRGKKV